MDSSYKTLVKFWNPDWKPESFICDFDKAEISALEQAFEGALCFIFHVHNSLSLFYDLCILCNNCTYLFCFHNYLFNK